MKLTATRHTPATGIVIGQHPDGWRHYDTGTRGQTRDVGPVYASKAEALADHEAYMKRGGWII